MTIRQKVVFYLLEDSRESRKSLRNLVKNDDWANIIFEDEKNKLRIENYLDGVMPARVMRVFEHIMQKDDNLKKEFELRKRLNDKIQLIPLIENLNSAQESFDKEYKNKEFVLKPVSKAEHKKLSITRWSVAASIVLLLGLGSLYVIFTGTPPSNDELFSEYYEPLKFNKGTDVFTANSNLFLAAREKYKEKDYKSAYVMFKGLPDLIDIQYEKNFYLGLILIEMAEYSKAISFFELSVKNNFEFLPQAYWYLGLCYLKTGEYEKAVERLEYLISGSNYKEKEARKILKVLK